MRPALLVLLVLVPSCLPSTTQAPWHSGTVHGGNILNETGIDFSRCKDVYLDLGSNIGVQVGPCKAFDTYLRPSQWYSIDIGSPMLGERRRHLLVFSAT